MPFDNPTLVIGGVRQSAIQVAKNADLNQYAVISYSSGYNANQFNGSNTDQVQLKIERSALPGPIRQAMIRFKMTSTSTAVQLAPTPYWLNRLEIWQNSEREIQRMYSDELFLWNLMSQQANKLRTTKKQLNLNQDAGNYYNTEWINASTTQYYYLPIPSTWLEMFNPNLNYISGDLWLRLYPAGTPINTDGSTANTPSLIEIALVYQSNQLSNQGLQKQAMMHKEIRSHTMLHPVLVPTSPVSYAASSSYIQTLEAVNGKCPLMIFALRANSSLTSSGVLKNVDLGDTTTVSVATPAGQDIFYNGSPAKLQATRWFAQDEFVNPDFMNDRNWYVVSFGNSVGNSLLGKIDGFIQFDGSKYQHILNTGGSGTANTQTVTLSAAATAGSYYIVYKGCVSAELAYNASTSAMATAFGNLLSALNHPQGPISCSFSAAASAGTTVVCTLNGPNGNIVQSDDLVTFVFDTNTSGSAITSSTAQTTYAVSGFPTANTYTLQLYAYVFCNVYLDTNKRVVL